MVATESGRAGRDGEAAFCFLFYCYKDKIRLESFIDKSARDNVLILSESTQVCGKSSISMSVYLSMCGSVVPNGNGI